MLNKMNIQTVEIRTNEVPFYNNGKWVARRNYVLAEIPLTNDTSIYVVRVLTVNEQGPDHDFQKAFEHAEDARAWYDRLLDRDTIDQDWKGVPTPLK